MKVNADFCQRVMVDTGTLTWSASPMPGVHRRMLDRIGGEVARATTIVRYAPGSSFSQHTHDGGEEFIVLEGVFQDEHGDYPAGSYVRNPPTTHHVPASADGCTIFVKLWQFDPGDRDQKVLDMNSVTLADTTGGASAAVLHSDTNETVTLHYIPPAVTIVLKDDDGAEALVLSGSVEADGQALPENGWLRLPPGDSAKIRGGKSGARLWTKTGHLSDVTAPGQES